MEQEIFHKVLAYLGEALTLCVPIWFQWWLDRYNRRILGGDAPLASNCVAERVGNLSYLDGRVFPFNSSVNEIHVLLVLSRKYVLTSPGFVNSRYFRLRSLFLLFACLSININSLIDRFRLVGVR